MGMYVTYSCLKDRSPQLLFRNASENHIRGQEKRGIDVASLNKKGP